MPEQVIRELKQNLKDKIKNFYVHAPRRIYIDIDKKDVPQVIKYIFLDLDGRFVISSGVDTPQGMEILYHLTIDRTGQMISVRTLLDAEKPEVESITPIIKGAEWIEREMWELLGINFKNHPNLTHLLLTDEWPKGNYPLRRKSNE